MTYRKIREEQNEEIRERYALCKERVAGIPEETGNEGTDRYFQKTASLLQKISEIYGMWEADTLAGRDLATCREWNVKLYGDLQGEGYETCYANPDFAAKELPQELAGLLCFLSSELYGLIPLAFEGKLREITILTECYLEIYGLFAEDCRTKEGVSAETVAEILRAHFHDYSEILSEEEIRAKVDPELDFFTGIVRDADLSDAAYLYRYGAYIGENEERMASFLQNFSGEEIDAMAKTWTEGYRIGFAVTGKDLSKKRFVTVEYPIGFERIVRAALRQFADMGLTPVIFREAVSSFQGLGKPGRGCAGVSLNRQYGFDHRNDQYYYLDRAFMERRLEAATAAFRRYREKAKLMAGPAVMEYFGEAEFHPRIKETAPKLTEKQNALNVQFRSEMGRITNEFIPGEERSFTVIAYPLPSIGPRFPEIFRETVRVNTLDYALYQSMQQKLVDLLDTGVRVHVTGKDGNRTDLTVALQTLSDPAKETLFENCVADVNIPVGEVFTTPKLKGTNGLLHVSRVYLNGFAFEDLAVTFTDGMVTDYTCGNFEKEEDNRSYIYENILMRHETLPLGEFAIGTNTTAYCMAREFQIESKLPILIAEKTGPHFAVGDTCYSYEEDLITYNPDKKAIIARENEVSMLRKTDPEKAYLNCHTDITIPYDELAAITVIRSDGSEETILKDGRFIVPGTEPLNEPLERRSQCQK